MCIRDRVRTVAFIAAMILVLFIFMYTYWLVRSFEKQTQLLTTVFAKFCAAATYPAARDEEVRLINIEEEQVVPEVMGSLSSHIKKEKDYSNLDPLTRTILSDVYSTAKRIIGIDPELNRETGGLLLLSYVVQSIQGHAEELHGPFNNSKKTFMDKFRVIKNHPQLEEDILKKFFGIEVNNYIKEEEEEGEEIVRIKGPYLSLEYIVRKIEGAAKIKNLAKSLVFLRQALMDATTLWIHNLLEGKKDIRFTYDKSILKLKDPKEIAKRTIAIGDGKADFLFSCPKGKGIEGEEIGFIFVGEQFVEELERNVIWQAISPHRGPKVTLEALRIIKERFSPLI